MEGGTWKQVFECGRPRCAQAHPSRSCNTSLPGTNEFHLMTDVVSGVFSVICTALFSARFVWHPKTRFLLKSEREALARLGSHCHGHYRQHHVEVPIHCRRDDICLDAMGDPDHLLRGVGHALKKYLNALFSGITFKTTP
jgi:lactate permease